MHTHWSQFVPNMSSDIRRHAPLHYHHHHLHTPFLPSSPSPISLVVSVNVKHHAYLLSVDVKHHVYLLSVDVKHHVYLLTSSSSLKVSHMMEQRIKRPGTNTVSTHTDGTTWAPTALQPVSLIIMMIIRPVVSLSN